MNVFKKLPAGGSSLGWSGGDPEELTGTLAGRFPTEGGVAVLFLGVECIQWLTWPPRNGICQWRTWISFYDGAVLRPPVR